MIVAGLRVDEHDLVALLEQHLAGLRAGVVELGGLPDDDRARSRGSGSCGGRRAAARVELAHESASNRSSESCGPGPGLGVVLDGAGGDVEQPQPLDRAVVEVHVGELGRAEVRLQARAGLAADREAVVLAT